MHSNPVSNSSEYEKAKGVNKMLLLKYVTNGCKDVI